jgi:hypothetical protein
LVDALLSEATNRAIDEGQATEEYISRFNLARSSDILATSSGSLPVETKHMTIFLTERIGGIESYLLSYLVTLTDVT